MYKPELTYSNVISPFNKQITLQKFKIMGRYIVSREGVE